MLERLTAKISGPSDVQIDWVKSPDEIVEGVEAVFSAIKDQADNENEFLKQLFELLEKAAGLAGEALELPLILAGLAAFAPFAGIGAGYLEAIEQIKRDTSPIAFAEGVAMGVMAETPDFISDEFWVHNPPSDNDFIPQRGKIIQYYTNGALVLGYAYGKELQGDLTPVFWADLKRVDDQSLLQHGDPTEENWQPNDWRSFYIDIASAFMKLHVSDD
jgi:hypothetical protein